MKGVESEGILLREQLNACPTPSSWRTDFQDNQRENDFFICDNPFILIICPSERSSGRAFYTSLKLPTGNCFNLRSNSYIKCPFSYICTIIYFLKCLSTKDLIIGTAVEHTLRVCYACIFNRMGDVGYRRQAG